MASKTTQVQAQVDEVVGIMQDNIHKVMQRGEQLDSLQNKTEDLQNSSLQFKRGANKVRREMWWKDLKLKLIIGGIVAVILIIIIACRAASSASEPTSSRSLKQASVDKPLDAPAPVEAGDNISAALRKADPSNMHMHSWLRSFAERALLAPASNYMSGIGNIYSGASHSITLWNRARETGPATNREDIRHVLRNKLDLLMVLPGTAYMALPFKSWTLPLGKKLSVANATHQRLAPVIRAKLATHLESIPLETLRSSPAIGAERRRAALVHMLRNPSGVKEADFLEMYNFFWHHLNVLSSPTSLLQPIGAFMQISLPFIYPRARMLQWGDWIIKDDKLLRQDGIKTLSDYELFEALQERGYAPPIDMPTPQLQAMLSKNTEFASRIVESAVRHRMRINSLDRLATLSGDAKAGGAPAAAKPSETTLTTHDIAAVAMLLAVARVAAA
ncbi:hypothetical protein HK105_207842 [Polyrhizophydium stewartii]|uniref:V-SNARE coiled-coil homology domain-containing protein n=1 Tax=Polyrhizophydium stewartii TaxID=2732419 RepID=A0ABR4MZC5_9FUNG